MADLTDLEPGAADVVVAPARFEHHRQPFGIGEHRPRLSWVSRTDRPDWVQAAYEVEIRDRLTGGAFMTGRIDSVDSVLVDWPGPDLGSRGRRAVRVRVWGHDDRMPSPWSEPAEVETGPLDPSDWVAALISADWDEDTSQDQPPALFRRDFLVDDGAVSARLYVTAHGVYQAELNGRQIGDHVLAPGWTSYNDRLRYQTFDVTDFLRAGANVLGATVGDGWFRGRLGFRGGRRNVYGTRLGLFAQLEIRYDDGSIQRVVTDSDWRAGHGPIQASGIYAGETHDARRDPRGWSEPGFDDRGWAGVLTKAFDVGRLVTPTGPPVRRIETLAPVAISRSPSGRTIVDFGQNLVGRMRIRVRGEAGTVVTIRHAEVLEDGDLCTRPLRHAEATDRYILSGAASGEAWEPWFTFHGFRYAEIDGWPGDLMPEDVEAVVIHTDLERTGWFECSDPMLNRLHENVVWSMRGNFVDIPTDCPQRDERLGWTGDLQVFAPTASFLYDCAGMLDSWLRDLAVEQERFGTVPAYVRGSG